MLLTLKAVLVLHGFEVETARSCAEAFTLMESSVFQMVISDLCMETEEAGLEVIRAARRQSYDPATALLTAYPPSSELWETLGRIETRTDGIPGEGADWSGPDSDSLLIKPLGTGALLRQVEALLLRQADRQLRGLSSPLGTNQPQRPAG